MDEFGFPPLEVEQATMVIANITDPIDLPWNNTDNLFTRLITLKSIVRREERIKKRLKGKGMFGEIPFMQSSVPFYLSFGDYAEPPRPIPLSEAEAYLDSIVSSTETSIPDREGAVSATTECQRYGMANGCDEYCPVLRAGLCELQDSDNAALYAAAMSNSV